MLYAQGKPPQKSAPYACICVGLTVIVVSPLSRVLHAMLSSQTTGSVPMYSRKPDKIAHASALLATLATVWEQYGFRLVSCH